MKANNSGIILCLFTFFLSCSGVKEELPSTLFSIMPSSRTHIRFGNELRENEEFNIIEYLYFNNGAGVAAGDINNDGLVDLYFASNQAPNKLYLNLGELKFRDITAKAGVSGEGDWKTGVTMADVNGDGYLDIYVCQVGKYKTLQGKNQLFINNGDLTFTERAAEYGLDFIGFSTMASFFDYDLDGDLDMYLLNHSVHTTRSYGHASLRFQSDPVSGDRLFRNDRGETGPVFRDVTSRSGIFSSQIGYGLGISTGDLNNDGYPDIYISNDFHENDYLYINNRDGTFTDHFTRMIAYSSRSSMGNDIGDINNDGLFDIIVPDMLPEKESILKRSGAEEDHDIHAIKAGYGYHPQFVRNTLQLNLGVNVFAEIGRLAGVYSSDWSWSPLFCDLDNDGWKDIYISNGIYRRPNDLDYIRFLTGQDIGMNSRGDVEEGQQVEVPDKMLYEKMPLEPLVNYVYRNNGDLTFTNKSSEWGMDIPTYSNGTVYADLDNDGDLEIIINNINQEASVFRNNSDQREGFHYVKFRLHDAEQNTFGIGARIHIYTHEIMQSAENFTTRGFMSSVPPELHFGIREAAVIDSAIIRWPGGVEQKFFNLPADSTYTIVKKNAGRSANEGKRSGTGGLFVRASEIPGLTYRHRENHFVDFNREPLMPHVLSTTGPCMAAADVNGDGFTDLFFGGARGQEAELYLQTASGFIRTEQPDFVSDSLHEDTDAEFFDADGDRDMDLYVVSGGNEYPLTDPHMQDRLYLNNGKGKFHRSKSALPSFYHNGSCVAIGDFNQDLWPDIFSGSISIPGNYGLTPTSYLLQNNGNGTFSLADHVLQGGSDIGMVSDAEWADINGDGRSELVLAGEWMPVTIYTNHLGSLEKSDEDNGLQLSNGLWRMLKAADLDADGDIDFLAGNYGLNGILTASEECPLKMYLMDVDNNGSVDPVITRFREGKNFPVVSRDDLFKQIPALKNRFGSYASFAGKTFDEIFSDLPILPEQIKNVYRLESCVLINHGSGIFSLKPLPVEVQFSPVMAAGIYDYNMDKIPDIVLGGNLYLVHPTYGMHNASFGWYLEGVGNGNFRVKWPGISGLRISGEIRDMEMMKIGGRDVIFTGINNSKPQVFVLNSLFQIP